MDQLENIKTKVTDEYKRVRKFYATKELQNRLTPTTQLQAEVLVLAGAIEVLQKMLAWIAEEQEPELPLGGGAA